LAPPPSDDEVRAANAAAGHPDALVNKQEYKALKEEVADLKKKADQLPPDLTEDE